MENFAYVIFESRFGKIGVVGADKNKIPKIIRIFLPPPKKKMEKFIQQSFPDAVQDTCYIVEKICKKIVSYLKGELIDFTVDNIDLFQMDNFQKRVLMLVRKIPRGYVSTYGRLAKKLGVPKASRAVGQALARNPFPIIIPCHRVIKNDGSLGGFGGGVKLKRKLLELEGIRFDASNKVVFEKVW